MSSNPIRIRPSSRPQKSNGGCGSCGGRIKKSDSRLRGNPRRTIRKKF